METVKCIKERRSIRKFKDMPVSHDVINSVIETAAFAPSWKNTQIARYIVLENKETISKIANDCVLDFVFNKKTMLNCAALILVTIIKGRSGFEKDGTPTTSKGAGWEMFDAGIATQTFCLAAHDKGIGTVIMGIFDEAKVAGVIDIPEGQKLAAFIAIGYPDIEPAAPKRKTPEELVTYL